METLKEMITRHEGKRAIPYKCTAGKLTIGIGHNIDANGLPNDIQRFLAIHGRITEEMIDRLYEIDVSTAIENCLELYSDFNNFSEVRKMALIDFMFNVGEDTADDFIGTNVHINNGEWEEAANHLKKTLWYKQVGKRGKEIVEMIKNG